MEIDLSMVSGMLRKESGFIYEITLKDGRIIKPIYAVEDKDKIIVYTSGMIFTPFSDIQSVWVHYFDVKMTLLVTLGFLGYFVIQNLKSY